MTLPPRPRRAYPTDLSDAEWRLLEPLSPPVKPGGRPARHTRRELLNAIAYAIAYWMRSGCAWRLLPHDLPPWQTVYHYFRLWRRDGLWEDGLWEQVLTVLREHQRLR